MQSWHANGVSSIITIDKTIKCQLLVFSYLFEVEPLQGCGDGCFD